MYSKLVAIFVFFISTAASANLTCEPCSGYGKDTISIAPGLRWCWNEEPRDVISIDVEVNIQPRDEVYNPANSNYFNIAECRITVDTELHITHRVRYQFCTVNKPCTPGGRWSAWGAYSYRSRDFDYNIDTYINGKDWFIFRGEYINNNVTLQDFQDFKYLYKREQIPGYGGRIYPWETNQ